MLRRNGEYTPSGCGCSEPLEHARRTDGGQIGADRDPDAGQKHLCYVLTISLRAWRMTLVGAYMRTRNDEARYTIRWPYLTLTGICRSLQRISLEGMYGPDERGGSAHEYRDSEVTGAEGRRDRVHRGVELLRQEKVPGVGEEEQGIRKSRHEYSVRDDRGQGW